MRSADPVTWHQWLNSFSDVAGCRPGEEEELGIWKNILECNHHHSGSLLGVAQLPRSIKNDPIGGR